MQLNELQRFVKNFFFKTVSWLISGIVSIVVISRLSAALAPDGFGKYNFLLTYASYFIFLTSLGTDIVAIRLMSRNRNDIRRLLGSLISLKLVMTAAVFIMMLLPMLFVPKLHGFGWMLVIFSTQILPFPFSAQCVFEATKRMEFPSLIAVGQQLLNLVLVIVFVHSPDDLLAAGLILVVINVIIFLTHTLIFVKYYGMWRLSFNLAEWKLMLKDGIIIGFIQLINMMIHYFNITLLGLMTTDFEVGIFSAAYRVIFMILSVFIILHNLITPIFFENYGSDMEKFKFYYSHYEKMMVYLSYFIMTMSFFLAVPILGIFYDLKTYHGCIVCFQILTGSILFQGINSPHNIGLIAMHREKTVLFIMTFIFIMNLSLNIILIPRYGINGSSISTVISQALGLPLYLYFFNKNTGIKPKKDYVLGIISVIPVALALYFTPVHFIIKAILGTVVMAVMSVAIGGYTVTEIKFIWNNLLSRQRENNL